jgi:hypothetical protein
MELAFCLNDEKDLRKISEDQQHHNSTTTTTQHQHQHHNNTTITTTTAPQKTQQQHNSTTTTQRHNNNNNNTVRNILAPQSNSACFHAQLLRIKNRVARFFWLHTTYLNGKNILKYHQMSKKGQLAVKCTRCL